MIAEISSQEAIVWGGMLFLGAYLYFRLLRFSSRQPEDFRKPAERAEEYESTGKPAVDVSRWQVEMHETARDLKAELDSKMVALQVLIHSAREEQARLTELIEKAEAMASRETP